MKRFGTFYMTNKGRVTHLLNNLRARAKRADLEVTITREWITERLERGICEATGIPLVLQAGGGKGHVTNPFSPSIERVDRALGYTPANCLMTCWIYNRAKGAFRQIDFDRMCIAYVCFNWGPVS